MALKIFLNLPEKLNLILTLQIYNELITIRFFFKFQLYIEIKINLPKKHFLETFNLKKRTRSFKTNQELNYVCLMELKPQVTFSK